MTTLLSNAFGRKNLLGGVGRGQQQSDKKEEPAPEQRTPTSGRDRDGDGGLGIRMQGSRDDGGSATPRYNEQMGQPQNLFGAAQGNAMNQPLWTPTEANRAAPYAVNDPVSMHLLMENALEESRRYEVLSEDEVRATRTELDSLSGRIEAAQRKLALETKVRDTSKTMNQAEKMQEADQAAQRCDALLDELNKLRDQEQALQRRLLEHTAGVLQMTHKGYIKDQAEANGAAEATFDHSHYYEPSLLLDSLDGPGGKLTEEQESMIRTIQQRVEDLNTRIRKSLRELNAPPRDIPAAPRNNNDPEEAIENTLDQVNSLDQCFIIMQQVQSNQSQQQRQEQTLARGQADEAKTKIDEANGKVDEANRKVDAANSKVDEASKGLGDINQNLYRTIKSGDSQATIDAPPTANASSIPGQLRYLQQVQRSIQAQSEKIANFDETIAGLWQMLAKPEDGDYTLMAFSSKVQEMNIKYSSLQDQKVVLQRQIQQQREANDAEAAGLKDAEIEDLKNQLEKSKMDLENTESEMDKQLENLSSTITDLETDKAAMGADHQAVQEDLKKELGLEKESRKLADERAQKATKQLEEANNLMEVNSQAIKADLVAKTEAADKAEASLRELEGEVAGLKTELTITKAELDGAYGTRAERAAERDPEMQERVKELEKELEEMNADYESMTKATIEHEKEKDEMETLTDELRSRIESLEAELQEERVQSLGAKGGEGGGGGSSTSAAVLRNEFKKMMKDAREGHSKALKAEKDEKRKLEAEIRQLKRDAIPSRGKAAAA